MPYRIELRPSVEDEVAKFPPDTRRYFRACLDQIAADPSERHGLYVDLAIPTGIPARTFLFEIRQEISISDERVFAFISEFFAEYAILYTLREDAPVAEVFYLRWQV